MPSQVDLDQGGTNRQTQKVYLGPSVGWVSAPFHAPVSITTPGTTVILWGSNLVTVNVAGLVTVQLPPAKATSAGAQAIPGQFVSAPITVVDIGGNAVNFTITILPAAGETIDGLASITIVAAYGAYTLQPKTESGGWTLTQ